MDRWHWMMLGACATFAVVLSLSGCAAPQQLGIYSQISIINLPVHKSDEQ